MIARPLPAPQLPVPTVGGRAGRIAVLDIVCLWAFSCG